MSTVHRTALESDIRSAIMNKVIPDCCCVFCKVFAFLFAVKGMENGKELPRDARHEKQHTYVDFIQQHDFGVGWWGVLTFLRHV